MAALREVDARSHIAGDQAMPRRVTPRFGTPSTGKVGGARWAGTPTGFEPQKPRLNGDRDSSARFGVNPKRAFYSVIP